MEWDQIADRWAAMANRLRSDTVEPLSSTIVPRGTAHATQCKNGLLSNKLLPNTVSSNTRPLSNP